MSCGFDGDAAEANTDKTDAVLDMRTVLLVQAPRRIGVQVRVAVRHSLRRCHEAFLEGSLGDPVVDRLAQLPRGEGAFVDRWGWHLSN